MGIFQKNISDGETRIRVLNDAIACCSRAISHYDIILNDIARLSKEHRYRPWRFRINKICKNNKDKLSTALNNLKSELNNALSFVAFEKARVLHEESEKKSGFSKH